MAISIEQRIKLIKDYINDRRTMLALGEQARDLIYKRVKAGYGVSSLDGDSINKSRLKQLKKDSPYILQRVKYSSKLGEFGEPDFSNLTWTGQLLDSMKVEANYGSFKILIPNSGRRTMQGGRDKITNKKLAEHVQKIRPFLAITSAERQILKRTIEREIRTIVKRYF